MLDSNRLISESLVEPEKYGFKVSRDGSAISYFHLVDNDVWFVVESASLGIQKTPLPNGFRAFDHFWNLDGRFVVFLGDFYGDECQRILTCQIGEKLVTKEVFPVEATTRQALHLIHLGSCDPDLLVFRMVSTRDGKTLIYHYSMSTGTVTEIEALDHKFNWVIYDESDTLRVGCRMQAGCASLFWCTGEGTWIRVYKASRGAKLKVPAARSIGRLYFITDSYPAEYSKLYLLELASGEIRALSRNRDCDVVNACLDMEGLQWVEFDDLDDRYEPFSSRARTFLDAVSERFCDHQAWRVRSYSSDFSCAIIDSESSLAPASAFLLSLENGSDVRASDVEPLSASQIPSLGTSYRVESLETISRDGLAFQSFLFVPDEPILSRPLVVFVHGGPMGARSNSLFNPIISVLVRQGFTVLAPNFRGSSGFGRSFRLSGYGQWSTGMLWDIEDAIVQVRGDPNNLFGRTGILGVSYGGYASLMLSINSSFIEAAVAINPPCDLLDTVLRAPSSWEHGREELVEGFAGVESDELGIVEALRLKSPHLQRIESLPAICLVAAENDRRIRFDTVRLFYESLRERGVRAELVKLKEEGHVVKKVDSTSLILSKMSNWFCAELADYRIEQR